MGYSRNYQKYWDEKKRKRDEDVNNSSHTGVVLPQADAFMNGGEDTRKYLQQPEHVRCAIK